MISFEVDGTPIGQGVLRVNPTTRRMYEATKGHGEWRKAVVAAAREVHDDGPLSGPVSVTVIFHMPRLKAHYNSKGLLLPSAPTYVTVRPDLDHLLRAIGDSLKMASIVSDDNQIAHWHATKVYHVRPHARVLVREMDEGDAL